MYQIFNNKGDPLKRDRALRGSFHRYVESLEELRQRRLVHVAHQRHVADEEVQHGAARGDRTELLTGYVYFLFRLLCTV